MNTAEISRRKTTLRDEMRARRNALSLKERAAASQKIAQRVLEVVPRDAATVAVYLAHKTEANLDAAIRVLVKEKIVVAPRAGARPRFTRLTTLENLRTNARGLRFPGSDEQFSAWEIAVFFVPGIAFDEKGNRLGQGGGWYDKTLQRARAKNAKTPLVVGLCYECQMVDSVPHDGHDERVDIIITEDRVLEVNTK